MSLIQLATDNFSRGSYPENPLGSVGFSDAGKWTAIPTYGGGVNLQSVSPGVCEPSAAGNSEMYWSGSGAWSNDQYSEVTIGAGTTGYEGPGVRLTTTGGYIVSHKSGTAVTLYKLANPGYTSLGNFSSSLAFTTGDVFRLTVIGTSLTFYKNGVPVGSPIIDSTYSSGYPGAYANGSASSLTYTLWAGGGIPNNITGNCGIGGATVAWTGAASGSTTADNFGNYDSGNLGNGTYTVTPSLAGFTFSPTNQNETLSGTGQVGVNFAITQGSAFVQGNHVDNQSGISVSIPFSSGNTKGNLIVIAVRSGSSYPLLVTDTQYNIWTQIDEDVNGTYLSFWYAPNCAAGANTVTVTWGASASNVYLAIGEYSGVVPVNPLDAHGITTGTSTTPTAPSIEINIGELVIGYSGDQAGETYSAGANYTLRESDIGVALEDVLNVGASNQSSSFGMTGSTQWIAGAAAFKIVPSVLASPTFSPSQGNYATAQTVTITGPVGSTIYYTTDGTTPTHASSSIVSGSTISVSASFTTVNAISTLSSYADSLVATSGYSIGSVTLSALAFTVTDTTIAATWTTAIACDSNLSAGGKTAVDNGVQSSVTSHWAIVTGLTPNTIYSCIVTSGFVSSSAQNVTTLVAHATVPITAYSLGSAVQLTKYGDDMCSFVSNDNIEYIMQDDGSGLPPDGSESVGAHFQLLKITNETPGSFAGSQVNEFANYTNASDIYQTGLFGFHGNLYAITNISTESTEFPVTYNETYGGIIKSTDHGATWNNWQAPTGTPNSGGIPPSPTTSYMFAHPSIGALMPVRYAIDDGTIGYATAGNCFDGGNAFIYLFYLQSGLVNNSNMYLMRIPRAQMELQNGAAAQYWGGPASPTSADFVNDANWLSTDVYAHPIYTSSAQVSWSFPVFIPTINRYLWINWWYFSSPPSTITITDSFWQVLEAPTPAGPWTQVGSTLNFNPSGWYTPTPLHRTVATNTSLTAPALTLITNNEYLGNDFIQLVPLSLTASPYGISGSLGVSGAGATVSWSGASSGSVTADGSGNYNTGEVLGTGTYTITPTKIGYIFSPTSASETISGSNITGVNFTANRTGIQVCIY